MTEVSSASMALEQPDSALPAVDEVESQLEPTVKEAEEEKVQDDLPATCADDDTEQGVVAVAELYEKVEEEQKEFAPAVEQAKECVKEQDEQQLEEQLELQAENESVSPPHAAEVQFAAAQSDDDSDSDDSEYEQGQALPTAQPAASALPVLRSNFRGSILEQQIAQDEKQAREYHVPHLADFDFSTPTPSEPNTPVPAASATPQPFRLDPAIILLPDTERFSAASLPLLYPKLALTLSRSDVALSIKLCALRCCVELTRSPLHVHELQAHGVLDELIVNAGAGDEQLRVLATEALGWAVRQREARQFCRENGLVVRLCSLLIDHSATVRGNAARVLLRLSATEPQLLYEAPVSAAAGDAASVMAYLVRRVQTDSSDDVKALLLRCVLCGLKRREGLIVARYNNLLPVIASLPPLARPPLIAAACDCVAAVAVEDVDRQELLSLGLHTAMLQWLPASDVAVRRSAAGALMQATVGVAVKQAVVAAGGVELCAQRVKSEEAVEAVLCVLLQLLANLMESKKGRQLVDGDELLLTAVRTRAEDKTASDDLRLSAQSALQKLTYAP